MFITLTKKTKLIWQNGFDPIPFAATFIHPYCNKMQAEGKTDNVYARTENITTRLWTDEASAQDFVAMIEEAMVATGRTDLSVTIEDIGV